MSHGRETFDENTLFKVLDSLMKAGLTYDQARETITDMQNKGILFRERSPETNIPSHPVYRGLARQDTEPLTSSIAEQRGD